MFKIDYLFCPVAVDGDPRLAGGYFRRTLYVFGLRVATWMTRG